MRNNAFGGPKFPRGVAGRFVAVMLVVAVLAGCSEAPGEADPGLPAAEFEDLVVTQSTGAIRGIVVSEAIVPIGGADVAVTGTALTTVSDEDGTFVFSSLEPGTYFLEVAKEGYFTTQASTD